MLLDAAFIRIWHWQNGSVPTDVTAGQPDPARWGLPTADFDSAHGGCEIEKHFKNQTIVRVHALTSDPH